jgi:hypothetical protein
MEVIQITNLTARIMFFEYSDQEFHPKFSVTNQKHYELRGDPTHAGTRPQETAAPRTWFCPQEVEGQKINLS